MTDAVPSLLIACAIGFLSGLHTSTWGMYKDAPHEGFSWPRYVRSAIVGAIMGAIAWVVARPRLDTAAGLVAFFGVTYVLERGAIECWKTFLRTEDQSKYFIPMQFAVFGRVIHSQAARLLIGALITSAVIFAFLAVHWLAGNGRLAGSLPAVLIVASIGGWISAFLGAWKDAPIEGFQPLKFVRSPLWAAGYGSVLSLFTMSPLVIIMAALGYTIATLETYKTFFFPSKPRGKFAGKPILFPEMLVRRHYFVPIYTAIWLLIVTGFVLALTGPREGLVRLS
jgi:hypothetical protein